jgi:hypothetical protein
MTAVEPTQTPGSTGDPVEPLLGRSVRHNRSTAELYEAAVRTG